VRDIVDLPRVVGIAGSSGLAHVHHIWIGKIRDLSATECCNAVAFVRPAIIGHDGPEVVVAPPEVEVRTVACIHGSQVMIATKIVPDLVPEGVLASSATPIGNREHVLIDRSHPGRSTHGIVVDNHGDKVGTVLPALGMDFIHLPIAIIRQIVQGPAEGSLLVVRAIRMNQAKPSVDLRI